MKTISILAVFIFMSLYAWPQLTVQNGFNAQQLGNNLAGSNISVTNASVTGAAVQYGTFQFTGTGFPLSTGVVLTSGSVFDCPGPNSSSSTSTDNGEPGHPLLDSLAGVPTYDAVELKFDFTVQSDRIEFRYVFASEEYNEYVGSPFNDVFGFFISGPGIIGEENLAVVPNTNVPVTINNINLDSYWQYYQNNETGSTNIEFDGFTTSLIAKKQGLIPCETYTLKLIVADASDAIFNTAVFLEENSLIQGTVSASTNTYSENNIALEGCINASFTFSLDTVQTTNTYIHYSIGGMAVNGLDYTHIDTMLVIPAGQTSATIIIDAHTDGIAEGQESVELYFEPVPCQGYDTVIMYIQDYQMLEFESVPSDLSCFESGDGQIDFNINGGTSPYSIILVDSATGLSTTYTSYPITGLSTGTYQIQILDAYGCWAEDIVAGAIFDADTTFLPDGNGVSYSTTINISGLPSGQTLSDINQLQSICLEMEHSFMGDLLIQLQAPNGTLITLKQQPGGSTTNLGEPVATGPNDTQSEILTPGIGYQYCFTTNPSFGTMVAESHNYTYTYLSQDGSTQTDKYLPAGSYQSYEPLSDLIGTPLNGPWTIIVTDEIPNNNGYIFNWSISIAADRPDSIVTLSQPAEPVITYTSTLPSCGLNNGAVNLTVTGGNPPFTYLWSNGATTEDINNVPAGIIYVTVTDSSDCAYIQTISLPNSSSATATSTVLHESCPVSNDGSIDLTVTGGTPPYAFLWSNGLTTEDINMLSPGNYSIQVTDAAGCITAATYEILAAGEIIITGSVTNETCGNMDGAIDISIFGGIPLYSYIWSNSAITQDITGLQQGTYLVTVSDANSCIKTASFSVINIVGNCIPDCDLAITNSSVTDEICGNAGGSILLDIYTTHLPYTSSWNTGSFNEDLTGLSQGFYEVTVTDVEGCSIVQNFTVSNLTGTLAITSSVVNDEFCGNGNGEIAITPSGGALPYTYLWSTGATTQDITGLHTGIYELTLTDANTCAIHESFEINNNSGTLQLTYGNAMDAVCGQSNGSIDISVSGGVFPVTYLWSNGATTQDLINLPAGSYTCTITDATDCALITPTYNVNDNSGSLAFVYINIKNEICGNSNGEIKILANGGSVPYAYLWSTGATTQNLYNLNAGIYSGSVTDNNGCSITTGQLQVINTPGTLTLNNIITISEICSNGAGAIQLNISGGTQPYFFHWNTGSVSQNLYNLSAGAYTCSVTDSTGCAFTVNANIFNEPGSMNIENLVVLDEICGNGNGSINLILSGATEPVSYAWSNGSVTEDLTLLHAGIYTVTIQDSQGCMVNGTTQLNNQSGDLLVEIQSLSNEICSNGNGSINISVSGGSFPYAYLWNDSSLTEDMNNLPAGNYSCTVTDTTGCIVSTGNITINNSSGSLTISSAVVTDEICSNSNGAINITIAGGLNPVTYLWSDSVVTQNISGLNSGVYSVTVTDADNCSATNVYTVEQTSGTLQFSNIMINDEVCGNNNGSITLTVSGGTTPYAYSWSTGATTLGISGLSSGDYFLTIDDANGCSVQTGLITVNNNPGNFTITSISTSGETCGNINGAVNVTLSGGAIPVAYIWNNGSVTQDLAGLSAGVYSCTATDNSGCELHYSAVVQNDAGNLTVSENITAALCGQSAGSIDLTVNGGTLPYSFTWSNGATTEDLTGLSEGNYTIYLQDSARCYLSQTFTVESSGNVAITSVNITDEICGNSQGEIEIIAGGGTPPYQYDWTQAGGSPCCSYTLEMIDYFGDSWNGGYLEVYINGNLLGQFYAIGAGSTEYLPVCTGDQVELVYTPGAWEEENEYSLINSGGTVIFSDGPNPAAGSVYNGQVSCIFDPPSTNNLTGLDEGTYSVVITDANGCTAGTSVTIINNTGNFAINSISTIDDYCDAGTGSINITVSGGNTPYQYAWNNGATTQDISGLTQGIYVINITDASGCQITGADTVLNSTGTLGFVSFTINDAYCGDSTGAIDITVTGDELPIAYYWSNSAV
ncbi:MAG: choice-of-anchor L domain-containing protein, partial [Bacteroidia bacterium]|nr:choice-of-anchor L domain-containing protein [Bacteroidia bacterium]